MTPAPSFAELASTPEPRLDLLALALAAEFKPVDAEMALATLDVLGAELRDALPEDAEPGAQLEACARVLASEQGFAGDEDEYDEPRNSMLDVVLERRRGLPILLSVVYVEVARRAGIALAGVGLAGHFVVGHFGAGPPRLLDPFYGGAQRALEAGVRPWAPTEIAMRMLNNLTMSYQRRGQFDAAIRAATMRLALPADAELRPTLEAELRALQARLN